MIEYKSGYKYQLAKEYAIRVDIKSTRDIKTEYIELTNDGILTIKKGYCWDGPSGPTIDTKNFMRGSLIHDALYQLIRMKELALRYRISADDELRKICIDDGMSRIRAWWVYTALGFFGESASLPENAKKIEVAP